MFFQFSTIKLTIYSTSEYVTNIKYFNLAPETVRRGETVGIKCTVFNWIDEDVEVMINLRK